ncbi:hypothetical protein QBC38DRAFT_356395 [Podospora fimiseda]|uniref:Uncharacterized protein n=1 Tax=Podospora fimiseda TaxID=252190 RepID=A0AAN7H093_9PEZI|nr:hypothetical protein QBC38DRAFT_356395 [Podospora fimiseda]
MPSIAQETTTPSQSSKKRRRDDNDNSHHLTLYAAPRGIFNEKSYASTNHGHANLLHHQYASTIPPRTLMPLPSSKKQRTSVERDIEPGMDGEAMQRSPPTSPSQRSRSLADQSPTKQRPASPSRTSGAPATAAALMSRCHICFRKPTKKTDLDSFADCQGCGQRTCFVCIRECLGWAPTALQQPQILSTEEESSLVMVDADQAEEEANLGSGDPSSGDGKAKGTAGWERGGGHRQMVCSRCCIERGTEGDVVCLGCLPFVEG